MVKYKTKSDKVKESTAEAEERAKREAEEAAQREAERLEEERLEAERQLQIWYLRPGPVPIGWSFSVDGDNGEFYWREDDPSGTTTWDRPACIGEEYSTEEMIKIVDELRKKRVGSTENGYWQWALQKLWMVEEPEEGHGSCNLQRPGSKDTKELSTALTLLRYFLKGPRKDLQNILLRSRHLPHEKLPPRLHNASVVTRIIELLAHDEADVRHGAACALAAGCCEAHRGFQDAVSSNNAIPMLLDLLWDNATVQAGALALGRACEHGHQANQDAIVKSETGATQLLDLIEDEDEGIAKSVQYAIFWANVNARQPTKTHWDRSRGLCMSLTKPKKPCFLWEPAFCRRHHLEQFVDGSKAIKDGGRSDVQLANNQSLAKSGRVAIADQYLQLMIADQHQEGSASDPESRSHSKIRKRSKMLHTELGHQAPNHAHQRLKTKHDAVHGHHHLHGDIFDELGLGSAAGSRAGSVMGSRRPSKLPTWHSGEGNKSRQPSKLNMSGSWSGSLPLQDDSSHTLLALPEGSRPGTEQGTHQEQMSRTVSLPALTTSLVVPSSRPATAMSHRSMAPSQVGSEASDYDLHHCDPGLDDQSVCRIGQEVRHCTQTGFLKPLGSNKRYGICT